MRLVERHIIKKSDPRWAAIDEAAFRSKNLWNAANYLLRQSFIHEDTFLLFKTLYGMVRDIYLQDYEALPRKVSNQVLKQLYGAWLNWFKALKAFKRNPDAFTGRPRMPDYKAKQKGRNRLVYDCQSFSQRWIKQGLVVPSQLGIEVRTQIAVDAIQEVHIVPQATCYVVEVIYVQEEAQPIESSYVAGVDLGLNNLAAVASNKQDVTPFLVNGRPLKAINQFYNERKAQLQAQLSSEQKTSRRIQQLTHKRNMRVRDYLHRTSRLIIDWCVAQQIGTLIVGKNDGWKQGINIGKRNNQHFVQIPHAQFIEMLQYKGQLAGIQVVVTEESYTSKCSFLDDEPLQKHERYVGRRIKRGLFRARDGSTLNADINGAGNIIRKVIPNAFADGIAAVAVPPMRVLPV